MPKQLLDVDAACIGLHRAMAKSPKIKRYKAKLNPIETLWVRIMRRALGVPIVFFDAPLNKGDPQGTRRLGRRLADRLKRMTKRVGGELQLEVVVQHVASAGWRVRGYATPIRKPDSVAWRLLLLGQLR